MAIVAIVIFTVIRKANAKRSNEKIAAIIEEVIVATIEVAIEAATKEINKMIKQTMASNPSSKNPTKKVYSQQSCQAR